jgi:transposase
MEDYSDKTRQYEFFSESREVTTARFSCFVGVDLHKATVTLRAVGPGEELISSLRTNTKCVKKIEDWLNELPRPRWMAVEAISFTEWFIDRYRGCVDRIDIADATELARRRGKRRKTDRNDALDIAVRLVRGDCPLGFIADESLMHLRKLGRHWRQLSKILSRAKQSMRSIFDAANIRGPNISAATAQAWILGHGDLLKDVQREALANFIDILSVIERQRESLRRKIIFANRSEEFSARVFMLKSISGIDEIWACIIVAEVGPFDRFPNADTIEFWAGLTPDNKESAGRTQSGRITKAGSPTLRWALCQAAMALCRSDVRQDAVKQRLVKRVGKVKANVAMGRRLLRIIYAMMRDGTLYERSEPTDRLKRMIRKATSAKRNKKEVA